MARYLTIAIARNGRYGDRDLTSCGPPRWLIGLLQDTFHEIARNIGLEFDQIPRMPGWLQRAGFVDVEQVDKLIPIGMWPKDKILKEIGKYYQVHLLEGGK